MKNIVLDTNILYQEGLFSGRMKILFQLASNDLVTVYIPDIVKREFITKRVSELSDSIGNIQSNLKAVLRKVDGESTFKDGTKALVAQTTTLMQSVQESVEDEFEDWIKLLNAKIVSFDPVKIHDVLDDYFIGRGAFKSQKHREDFPDSIIHHSICNLVSEVGEIYVILADGAFKRGIKGQEDIITLNSLNNLFKLKDIEQHIASTKLQEYFEGTVFTESLSNYLRNQKEIIEQIYIEDGVENTGLLGIRPYAARLNFPSPKYISELKIVNFYPISETEFTADISFKTSATLHYVSDYGSYREIAEDTSRLIDMDSMNGDGMCDLYESVNTQYSGNVYLSFIAPQSVETIEAILQSKDDYESVSIELDIDTASIVELLS